MLLFSVVGFDYKDGKHTETIIAHSGNAIEAFNDLIYYSQEPKCTDAKVLRDSSEKELLRWYHLYHEWKRTVPD